MQSKVRITVLAAGFGNRHSHASSSIATTGGLRAASVLTGTEFEKVAPLNIGDIEVPAFLRYRSS